MAKALGKPTTRQIIWAAGIYEGEGSVHFSVRKRVLVVTIVQKDDWILMELKHYFGGRVNFRRTKTPLGRDSHVYTWRITSGRAASFLMTIYVLLSPRRKARALIALQAWKLPRSAWPKTERKNAWWKSISPYPDNFVDWEDR